MKESEDLTRFEEELKGALGRVDAPPELLRKTIERAEADVSHSTMKKAMPLRLRAWVRGAMAAALVGGAVLVGAVHLRREHERADEAQRQFQAAVRITDRTLDHARQQLERAGVQFGEEKR